MSEQNQHAEALFETLSKNKKMRRRRIIRTVLITIAVIAAILIFVVITLTKNVEKKFAAAVADVFADNAIAAESKSRLWLYLNCTITIAHVLTAIFCVL